MLDSISGRQLAEWQAFFRLEPFGFEWQEIRLASLKAFVVNLLRRKDDAVPVIEDFMLRVQGNEDDGDDG